MIDFLLFFGVSLFIVGVVYRLLIDPLVSQWLFDRDHDRLTQARREEVRAEAWRWPERSDYGSR